MKTEDVLAPLAVETAFDVLMVPGYTGSGPQHWQSLWEDAIPESRRVTQRDWNRPDVIEWPDAIDTAVRIARHPVVLVAHSCGVTAVALWAQAYSVAIAGAFLVAPADPASPAADENVRAFGPVPLRPFPFRSVVVGSENDPYCSMARARQYAGAWGSMFVNAGAAGHINTASGHGPWPEGRTLFDAFCASLLA